MRVRRPLHVPSADWSARQVAMAATGYRRRDAVAALERAAAAQLGLEVIAFGSARGALAAFLELAPPVGRQVVVPAYTCVAVPNAITTAGCTVCWVDVRGPNVDVDEAVREAPAGGAVLAQHTYGVAIHPDELRRLRDGGMTVIEDRAHRFDGRDVVGDAAIFSLEHSKVVSAGLGGLLWVRDPQLADAIRIMRSGLPTISWTTARRVLFTSVAQVVLDARWFPRAGSSFARRAAMRFPPTSHPAQTQGELGGGPVEIRAMHPDFATVALAGIENASANLAHRREIGGIYRERLASLVPDWAAADVPLIRQPIVVDDAEALRLRIRGAGIELGPRWFEAPIHPRGSVSSYQPGRAPRAERLAASVLSLPTHPRVDPATAVSLADAIMAAL